MKTTETPLGTRLEIENALFFFGNRNSTIENLTAEFPFLGWARLKQIHGDQIVHSVKDPTSSLLNEADAHWTTEARLALCITTADCVPILLHSPDTGTVAAIHAGWRGVANRILPKTLDLLRVQGVNIAKLKIALGPHIRQNSFEVDLAVQKALQLSAVTSQHAESFFYRKGEKFHVDLQGILLAQLIEFQISPKQVILKTHDTVTNSQYHSFRRERDSAGRQISFASISGAI